MTSLQDLLNSRGSAVEMLRNKRPETHAPAHAAMAPQPMIPIVPQEFSTWDQEQEAWRNAVVLYDQTHHMTDLYITGPDAVKLLTAIGTNNPKNFSVGRGNQLILCNAEGYYVADGILCGLSENHFLYNGLENGCNWITFHAETGGYDVKVEKVAKSNAYANGEARSRELCRFQLQGPNAGALIEKLNGAPMPQIGFFHMTKLKIGSVEVEALRHGMAGAVGCEFWAPFEKRHEIRETILAAGAEFNLHFVGHRAYTTASVESGWMGAILPAIYSSESTKAYREWLPADSAEGDLLLRGSYASDTIEDYYLTPYEVGYGPFVSLGHDFIGRDALAAMDATKQRRKVTLAWNADDIADLYTDMLNPDGQGYKPMDLPWPEFQMQTYRSFNAVMVDKEQVGVSINMCYQRSERAVLSLAIVDADVEIGNEVEVIWGEAGGNGKDDFFKKTPMIRIRAIVSPVPYSRVARESYAEGWRGKTF
ncbi:vanillate/3-O-methylgallate O-demethylase [Sphingobium sp. B1D7B]|uniref:aminomethyl transferase family protein n=1 Tax=Sphingobium sp. B1D7B TaxID=2940578 RepID=UPI002224C679|nr:aminomethyl transferase family protein [Sphingobium sp. B1D7B]MCW2406908.1 vanillate/3-O-methylgallate O-demethylase [Sphingobium sp. B1D7B]